jgi:hypothetical protein
MMHFTNFNKCSPSQLLYTLVAFKQHCTRLVQRYLQTSDGKRQKLLVEHHLHLEKMQSRMFEVEWNKTLQSQCESFHCKQVWFLSKTYASTVLCWARFMQGLIILTIKNPVIPFPYCTSLKLVIWKLPNNFKEEIKLPPLQMFPDPIPASCFCFSGGACGLKKLQRIGFKCY